MEKTTIPNPQRIASVDIYRGFVMFLMMAEVLEFFRVAKSLPKSGFWSLLTWHQSHVEWVGCSLHDMIQPSFSFLVGVALPYSIANRQAVGEGFKQLIGHTLWRSLILVLLGVFLRSMWSKQTYFTFEDTLSQIGLGYPILFFLGFQPRKTQVIALITILVGYWAAFALYPLPGADFNYASAGVTANWSENLSGFAAHWNKNTNFAWATEKWLLNLFPRESAFENNEGGYVTLSFIPTLGTMILGLIAGQVLRSSSLVSDKIKRFLAYSAVMMGLGLLLHFLGICPIVKRIWTPTWVLFSGGACFLFLAAFYWITDVKQVQKPFFWLKVIGMNSIAAYVMAHTIIEFINKSFEIHLGASYSMVFGADYASLIKGGCQLLVQWLVLYWMWKRKLFIRI
jgi:predicted acyltransferase